MSVALLARWHLYRVWIAGWNNSYLGCKHRGISQGTVDWAYRLRQLCRILCKWTLSRLRIEWRDNSSMGCHPGIRRGSTASLASSVTSVSLSPNSTCLVSISFDGALRFWDISSGSLEQFGEAIYGHSGFVRSVAFSPDGLSVASCSDGGSIKMWTVPTTTSTRTPGM